MKKKLIICVLFASLLFGCCGSESRMRSTVEGIFLDCQIVTVPNKLNIFLVKDKSGDIWYVEVNQMEPNKILSKNLIFKK